MRTPSAIVRILLATWALAAPALAGVIVVDPGGGDGAELLQSALDEAADGDIVLVRAGTYVLEPSARFVISGKALTLVTDAPTPPMLSGLEVHHVFSWQTVTVRGFTLGPVTWDDGPAVATVFVHDTDGVLWIEDCAIVGRLGAAHFNFAGFDLRDGSPAVQVGNDVDTLQPVTSLTLQRCTLTGGNGILSTKPFGTDTGASSGGPALTVRSGAVSLHECTLTGGQAGGGVYFAPANGGDGALLKSSCQVLFAGCDVRGGDNASQGLFAGETTLDGPGNGLTVIGSSSQALLRDSSFAPGTLVGEGIPGVPIESGPFGTFAFTDPARSFSVTSPVQEGAPGGVDVDGEPGDLVMLLFATDATSLALGGNQGVLVVHPIPIHLLTLGATDANGDLALGFTTPNLPASLTGITLYLQLLVQSDAGFTLEASSAFVWLDGSL